MKVYRKENGRIVEAQFDGRRLARALRVGWVSDRAALEPKTRGRKKRADKD